MISNNVNPNNDLYIQLQKASDYFNAKLFDNALSRPMLTIQRQKSSAGYFSAHRWRHTSGVEASEISLNPGYFSTSSLLQLFQTIVHEQCHLWQFEHGSPSRPGYHNLEWAEKMNDVGLIPSATGEPGGKRTGQIMSDYPAPDGRFMLACAELVADGFLLAWVNQGNDRANAMRSDCATGSILGSDAIGKLRRPMGRYLLDVEASSKISSGTEKQKIKYQCKGCKINVWGKPNLRIRCDLCNMPFGSGD